MGTIRGKVGLTLLALCWVVQSGASQAETDYIDVHVHILGTTESGILGNLGRPGSQPGQKGPGKGGPAQKGPAKKVSGQVQQENLQLAVENLIRKMDRHGVQRALVVVVPSRMPYDLEEKSKREAVMRHPDRLQLMAGGAVLSPFLQKIPPERVTEADRSRFRNAAEQVLRDGAVGFGEMLSYHLAMADHHSFQYAAPDHPLFLLLADIAAQRNVPIDLHMEAIVKRRPMPDNLQRASTKNPKTLDPTIPSFERLLAHTRKARIVWQHIGWDNTGEMTPQLVGRLMSEHPNLNIALRVERRLQEVGNGGPMPNRLVDGSGVLKPEWLQVIKKFSDRITIGSDEFFFPIESKRPNQSFVETWSLLGQLPKELANKLGNENPRRIYNLK
ncbi:MAG: amidohydrolase family protein [Thermodesulfobacteriota bacterium]